jgi:hypothetical protein
MGLEGSALTWKRRRGADRRRHRRDGVVVVVRLVPASTVLRWCGPPWDGKKAADGVVSREKSRKTFLFIYLAPNEDISLEKILRKKQKKMKQKIKLAQKQRERACSWGGELDRCHALHRWLRLLTFSPKPSYLISRL